MADLRLVTESVGQVMSFAMAGAMWGRRHSLLGLKAAEAGGIDRHVELAQQGQTLLDRSRLNFSILIQNKEKQRELGSLKLNAPICNSVRSFSFCSRWSLF